MKNLPITSCSECKHKDHSYIDNRWVCKKMERKRIHACLESFNGYSDIPDWCPLEDAEPKEIGNDKTMP